MRLIDADALIDRLKFKRSTDRDMKKYNGLESAISQINKMPTVDIKTEVKHGEWIDVPFPNNPRWNPNKKCSLCGRVVRREEENYCPSCGAKMRGER